MRTFIKHLFGIITIILMCGCSSEGETSYIPTYYGVIINSKTNEPFKNVTVSITNGYETRLSTKTDGGGKFRLSINVEDLTGDFYILVGDDATEKKRLEITGVVKSEIDLGIITIYPLTVPKIISFIITSEKEVLHFEGEIQLDDNWELREVGICYAKNNEPTLNDLKILAKTKGSSFSASINIDDLDLSSTYQFRAYAINSIGVGYSNSTNYETIYATPELYWLTDAWGNSYTDLTPESITLYAMASCNAYKITEVGFCYSTKSTPTIQDNIVKSGYADFWSENYYASIHGLEPNTKYYVRPYAINSKGLEGYGPEIQIHTLSGLATLKITYFDWEFGGYQVHVTIEDNGGGTIKSAGVCYSTKPNPDITDDIVLGNPGLYGSSKTFSVYLPISKYDAVYYVRAFVETQYGISYSQQESLYVPG